MNVLSHQDVLIRLLLAAFLGSVIGFERERLLWAAGIRTHMVVCVGACLIMIVSAFGLAGRFLSPRHRLARGGTGLPMTEPARKIAATLLLSRCMSIRRYAPRSRRYGGVEGTLMSVVNDGRATNDPPRPQGLLPIECTGPAMTVDQTLIRGLVTRIDRCSSGASQRLRAGVDMTIGH
jgi:hypothetical protein